MFVNRLVGEDGNYSAFFQSLVDAVINGIVSPEAVLARSGKGDSQERALAYLRAKEAGMLFEEDVAALVELWLSEHPKGGCRLSRNRIFNTGGTTYVADFCFENGKAKAGVPVLCLQCKSSPRPDRLELALAESLIGHQKTGGATIVTVVPYLTSEAEAVLPKFAGLGFAVVTLSQLAKHLDEAAKACR